MTAKMKSVSALGMKCHLPREDPRPRPKVPPDPSAYRDCSSWNPSSSGKRSGHSQPRIRATR
jgi:hypothetical protein